VQFVLVFEMNLHIQFPFSWCAATPCVVVSFELALLFILSTESVI
jgi:hypothetical protein